MNKPIITLKEIGKSFPGVRALNQINLSFYPGEIHAIVGENGAGKSTLMKILAGDYIKDSGEILIDGVPNLLGSPRRSQESGIGMIHQELTLLPDRTIAQNIMLGREQKGLLGLIDTRTMNEHSRKILETLDLDLNPETIVSTLPIALRQMVEIAKALSLDARVLILDEPTSSLTEKETRILLEKMKYLRDIDISLIYISHRLEEVFEVSNQITVLRDGEFIATKRNEDTSAEEVVRMMVGRDLGDMYVRNSTPTEEILLKVESLSGTRFQDFTMELRSGEVLGISGLVGAGRTEFARALFGLDPITSGHITIRNKKHTRMSVRKAIKAGLVYVPEDRKEEGLFLDLSVRKNLTINILQSLNRWGILLFQSLRSGAEDLIKRLNVRPPDPGKKIRNLSGGNQQKVVIAKWLSLNPRILILDEPTRGIDVGAKAEIYALIDALTADGVGVIVISSELPEILGISDRILVMRNGKQIREFSASEATQDNIMQCAAGATS